MGSARIGSRGVPGGTLSLTKPGLDVPFGKDVKIKNSLTTAGFFMGAGWLHKMLTNKAVTRASPRA